MSVRAGRRWARRRLRREPGRRRRRELRRWRRWATGLRSRRWRRRVFMAICLKVETKIFLSFAILSPLKEGIFPPRGNNFCIFIRKGSYGKEEQTKIGEDSIGWGFNSRRSEPSQFCTEGIS